MSPTFIENDKRLAILGTPGGSRIISMVLLCALEFVRGGDAEVVVTRHRFHHQYLPDKIQFEEAAISDAVRDRLKQMGYRFAQREAPYGASNPTYGNMQAVTWEKKMQQVDAASDPRGIGARQVADLLQAWIN